MGRLGLFQSEVNYGDLTSWDNGRYISVIHNQPERALRMRPYAHETGTDDNRVLEVLGA